MQRGAWVGLLVLVLASAARAQALTAQEAWAIPSEGSCAPSGGLRGRPSGEELPPVPFEPGAIVSFEQLQVLESYLPAALWEHRDRFFYEGMRLEIGPCFRDYAPPPFFREATARWSGSAKLLPNGGLEGYRAGLPFAPESIAPDDPTAGLKWAWNVEHRYQAGGFHGRFRMTDLVGRTGRAEPFEGEIFKYLLSHRAERPSDDYEHPSAKGTHWVAGGVYFEPFSAREYAWRQYRVNRSMQERDRSDELHAYLPTWRRVRRINAARVEGLYMPSFSVGVRQATQLAGGTGSGEAGAGGIAAGGGTGGVAGSISPKRSGYEGLELRPLLYSFEVLGVQDVLAPLNAVAPAYPENEDRDFGPWGLSFASDRWELRRALVLSGALLEQAGSASAQRFELYVDLQTLQPLYYLSWDGKGERLDVGYYVGRWSEDRPDYPKWPDDPQRPMRVIDPVGAAFANLGEGGSWRRESWNVVSAPPEDGILRRKISVGELTKRR